MKKLLPSVILSIVLVPLFGGCVDLSRPALAKHYYLLDAAPKPADPPPAHDVAIRVTGIEVSAPFSERLLVYRLDQERYESDFYNEYFVAPRSMITAQLVEWLTVRRIFATTLPPSSSLDAPYSIEGQVTALYGDLRNKAETEAVFSIQIFVTETINPDRRIVLQRNYSYKVRAPDRSAEAITKGLSVALQQSFSALETDLRALKVKP
jgi:cholesterol transport system auxiliary component